MSRSVRLAPFATVLGFTGGVERMTSNRNTNVVPALSSSGRYIAHFANRRDHPGLRPHATEQFRR